VAGQGCRRWLAIETSRPPDQHRRSRDLGGIVPFGFRVGEDGGLVPYEAKQVVIAQARALRTEGATLRALQAALEAQDGRKLPPDALQRVLSDSIAT